MKKITFLVVLVAFLFGAKQMQSQVINEPANWPNSDWEVVGSFSASGFNHNPSDNPYTTPTPGDAFGFDNQVAGSGSIFDLITVISPRYDLRAATTSTPAEEQVVVSFDYVYFQRGNLLTLQYTVGGGIWTDWQEIYGNSDSETDYVDCAGYMSFESTPLILTGFDEGELQNFKYRIFFDDNSSFGQLGGFCMDSPTLTSRETPLCFDITNITSDDNLLTYDSAVISWLDQNPTEPADGWELEYGLAGFSQGTGTFVTSDVNSYAINGLEDITCYDVYVRSLCDVDAGIVSEWVGPYNFCTLIGPTGCGDNYYDMGGPDNDYVNGILFSNDNVEVVTICPDTAGEVVTVIFDMFNIERGWDGLMIYDGPDVNSPIISSGSTFNRPSCPNGAWTGTDTFAPSYISATIENGGCLTFVFTSDGSGTRPGWEARILCTPPVTCLMPENLEVDAASITKHEASISWTDTNDSIPTNGWTVEYGEEGFELGTGTTVNTTSPNLDLTDLDAGTMYCFYVKANCGTDEESFWQGTTCFATLPGCGSHFYDEGGVNNNYFSEESIITQTICPDVSGEVVTVVFDMFDVERGYDGLMIYDGPNDSFPLFDSGSTYGTDNFRDYCPDGAYTGIGTDATNFPPPSMITATEANGGCLTFVFYADSSVSKAGWESRIFCSPPPTCIFPENLEAEARIHEVDLMWNDTNNDAVATSTWDIQYGIGDFELGTGTIVNITGTPDVNPYTLTGLDAETAYCVYVKANCDNGADSFWQGPVCFTTLCEVIVAPYVEDFENSGDTPNCWTQNENDDGDWLFSNDVTAPGNVGNAGDVTIEVTDPTGYFAYVDDQFSDGSSYTLDSPVVDISPLTAPTLSFYYLSHNQGGQNVNFSIDIWNGTDWILNFFTSNVNTNSWNKMILDLTDPILNITGPIQARFTVTDNNGGVVDDFAIDQVVFDEAPTCWPAFELSLSNITTTSVDLSWIDNNDTLPAGGWDIEVTYPTFPQGSGSITTVYSNPTTLTGLIPSSTYVIYIRTNCAADGSDSTEWTGPYEFTTPLATPLNNDCADAIELTVGTSECEYQTLGNNILATETTPELVTNCSDPATDGVFNADDQGYHYQTHDVWYKFYLPSSGTATIEVVFAGGMEDSVVAVYRASDMIDPCDNLEFAYSYLPFTTDIDYRFYTCRDDVDFDTGNNYGDSNEFSRITIQNRTPGDLYYIRVWSFDASQLINEDGSNRENIHGQFLICVKGAMDTRASALDTEEAEIQNEVTLDYYPNPVDYTLNLKSSNEIKIVIMYNMLGQEVLRKDYDTVLTETALDTRTLKTGTYFVKVLLSNDVIKTFKIIRN